MEPRPPVINFSSYTAERTFKFTGREWVLQAIDTWLADPIGAHFFVLTGEPGAGKTAIAARLVDIASGVAGQPDGLSHVRRGFLGAVHFCSVHDRRWVNPSVFSESLTQQLSEHYPVYAQAVLQSIAPTVNIYQEVRENWGRLIGAEIGTLMVATNPEDLFNRIVREPLEALARSGPPRPTVILVDALDESLAYTGGITIADLVTQMGDLPPTVRFILTCRPETELLRSLRRMSPRECTISPRPEASGVSASVRTQVLQDVQDYVQRIISEQEQEPTFRARLSADISLPGFVMTIRDMSEGNFLYVRYLLRMVVDQRKPITRESLAALPTGLDSFYLEFLQRLSKKSTEAWDAEYGKILGILAVCRTPVTEGQISNYTALRPTRVRSVLTKLRQILEANERAPARQRAYSLYHSSFAEFLINPDRAEEYWVDSNMLNRLIALHYWNNHHADWQSCDDYGLTYLAAHLLEGDEIERLQSLVDKEWVAVRYRQRNYNYDGLLGDIELAWRAAERRNVEQIASSGCASYTAEEVRCALWVASIGTVVSNIPADLIGARIQEGIWSPIQGLSYARHVPTGKERVEALATLAPHLPDPIRIDAFYDASVEASRVTSTEQRAQVLTWLLPRLPEDLRLNALINAITATRELKDQHRIAGGYSSHYESGSGTLYVNTGAQTVALSELGEALADLTEPRLSASEIIEQVRAVCAWEDENRFASAVGEVALQLVRGGHAPLAHHLDDEALSARGASTIAETRIGDEQEQADVVEAFEAMTPKNAETNQEKTLSALTAPGTYGAIEVLPQTFVALAPDLPAFRLREALELGQKVRDPTAYTAILRALAPRLPEPLLREVLTPGSRGFTEMLTAVAARLPEPLLREIVEKLQGIDDVHERAQAFAVMAPYLSEPLASEVLAFVRSVCRDLTRGRTAQPALVALAPNLPAALVIEVFASLKDAAEWGPYGQTNETLLLVMLALAPRLPEPYCSDAQAKASRMIPQHPSYSSYTGINDPLTKAIDLARQLPPSAQANQMINALSTLAISDARSRSAGRLYDSWITRNRISALIGLLPHLTEPYLTEAAEAAIRLIVEDYANKLPAEQTAALAQYIPANLLLAAEPAITEYALPLYLQDELLPEALKVAKIRKNAEWLSAVTGRLTDEMLREALSVAYEIGGALFQAELMAQHSDVFARLELTALYTAWTDVLRGMASLNRQTFLRNLRDLGPIVVALGGRNAIEGVLRAVEDVGRWWP